MFGTMYKLIHFLFCWKVLQWRISEKQQMLQKIKDLLLFRQSYLWLISYSKCTEFYKVMS